MRYSSWFQQTNGSAEGTNRPYKWQKHSLPSPTLLLYLVFWVKVHHSKGAGMPSEYSSNGLDHGNEQLAERALSSPSILISLNSKWSGLSNLPFLFVCLRSQWVPPRTNPEPLSVDSELIAPNSHSWVPHQAFLRFCPGLSPLLKCAQKNK